MNNRPLAAAFLISLCILLVAGGVSAVQKIEKATFAGGCFWCMITPFQKVPGVISVVVGYTGGTLDNPSYEEVSKGKTGHYEAVQVSFDPSKVSYAELLEVFWQQIDPTDAAGQFVDKGSQYKTAIFYHDETQKAAAEVSKSALIKSKSFDKPIVTEIIKATKFYAAEKYHQDYPNKNPPMYEYYRQNSGRDQFIDKIWKKK